MTRVLLLGSCLLRSPFQAARREAASDPRWAQIQGDIRFGGVPFFTRTLGEAKQAIDLCNGRVFLWPEIKSLCGINPDFQPNPRVGIRHIDVLLIEPDTCREIMLQGFYLNNRRLWDFIKPLQEADKRLGWLVKRWYEHMRVGGDDLAEDVASRIGHLLPRGLQDGGFYEFLFRSTVAVEVPIRQGLEQMRAMTDKPIGVIGRTGQYAPDGSPVREHAEFSASVAEAARDLQLPHFNPDPVIQAFGVRRALRKDYAHYSTDFLPIIALPLFEFTNFVVNRALSEISAEAGLIHNV